MLTIIIIAIIGGLWMAFDDGGYEPFFSFCGGALVGVCFGFFVAIVGGAIMQDTYDDPQPRVMLQNIADNTHTEGHFFLGSGTIEGVPHYSWYEQTGDNSFRRRDVDASIATIHFVPNPADKPYYVKTVEKYKDEDFWGTWGLFISSGETGDEAYDFYVPTGTITNDYTLDAK